MAKAPVPTDAQCEEELELLSAAHDWDGYLGALRRSKKERYRKFAGDPESTPRNALHALRYLYEGVPDGPVEWYSREYASDAAYDGNIAILEYLHVNGWPTRVQEEESPDYVARSAAEGGHIEVLQWLRAHDRVWCSEETLNTAVAYSGSLACPRFLIENSCPHSAETCTAAAYHKDIEALRYLRGAGCDWDERTCSSAAAAGSIECLAYARDNGCPWDATTCTRALDPRGISRQESKAIFIAMAEWLNALRDEDGGHACPCGEGPHALPELPDFGG
jgi:hypothetical protein